MSARPAPALARERVAALGAELRSGLGALVTTLPAAASAMQAIRATGMNKVFATRLTKALRQDDPVALVYHLPGPEPLRRFVARAREAGLEAAGCDAAATAVDALERCIREEAGGRSALNAVLSAWLPAEQGDYALGRKWDAFRAWSQIKGAAADTSVVTVLLHPSASPGRVDLTCFMGLLGLRRLRPGATVKLATRRLASGEAARRPEAHSGFADGTDPFRLREFCAAPPAPLEPRRTGETVHYLLGGRAFGLGSAVDMLVAEVNRAELAYGRPPGSQPRLSHVFAESSTPARTLVFDLMVHEDLYPGQDPGLFLYDTTFEGVADVNDPARDLDRLDLPESVEALGPGPAALAIEEMPRYGELIGRICGQLAWEPRRLRTFRCRIEYPPYGAQVVLAFDVPELPSLTKR